MRSKLKSINRSLGAWSTRLLAVSVIVILAFAAGFAIRGVTSSSSSDLIANNYTFSSVEQGSVESHMGVNASVQWRTVDRGINRSVGVVTHVAAASGSTLSSGEILFSINLRPTVVAQGEVPSFRELSLGSRGKDVEQLQQLLVESGYLGELEAGVFGQSTATAVRSWQGSLGIQEDGIVQVGDILYLSSLSGRLVLDGKIIYRGSELAGGEQILSLYGESPNFVMSLTDTQAAKAPPGTEVVLTSPSGNEWKALTDKPGQVNDKNETSIQLIPAGEGSICGDDCSEIPPKEGEQLSATVLVVPKVSGLTVPTSALFTTPDGEVVVIRKGGSLIPVTVIASAGGISVVEGADNGLTIRVPGIPDEDEEGTSR